jgi:long-chain acyl-CoA synthetase
LAQGWRTADQAWQSNVTSIISGERAISYPDIHARIARAATGFGAIGLGGGTPVAMMLRNDFALFEVSGAAAALGSPVVPINWHLKSEEVAYILADSGAEILVCHADLLPQIRDGLPQHLKPFVVTTQPEIAAAVNIRMRVTHAPSQAPVIGSAPMFYTSGTTGLPKGVRRTPMQPEQQAASARVGTIAYGIKPGDNQVVLMNGPMYHSAPNSYGMLAFRSGCTTVLEPRFDPEDLLHLIARHRVTHIHMVPTMFVRLLRLPDEVKRRYDLSSLRFIVHGAAPCPAQVKRAMIDWWGPLVHEYFGSTETGIPVWHSAEEALAKPGTVGRAIEGGIVKIFRPGGELCDINEPGVDVTIWSVARLHDDTCPNYRKIRRQESDEV